MKESIGYTLTLNIAIVFITIIFTFLSNIVIYYKGYKVSNIITSALEKYEGFNDLAYNEIEDKLSTIGYNKKKIDCGNFYQKIQGYDCFSVVYNENLKAYNIAIRSGIKNIYMQYNKSGVAPSSPITDSDIGRNGKTGYCVYKCIHTSSSFKSKKNFTSLGSGEYFYVVKTNLYADIPILNNIIHYYIYTNTNTLYDFEGIHK